MRTVYNIMLFYSNNCLQCDYVKRLLDEYNALECINMIDINEDNDNLVSKYSISRTPTVVIERNGSVKSKKVLNNKTDVEWLINNWCF